jgi:NAD(P)H dehydrogenase (quinone)
MTTFIYPIWWTGMPAMVKGYIDRVFTEGFAIAEAESGMKGLLYGKRVYIFNTTGIPEHIGIESGMFNLLNSTTDMAIFGFCGFEIVGHKYFSGVPDATEFERKAMLDEVKKIARENAHSSGAAPVAEHDA